MKNAILCCAGCGEEYGADAWRGLPWVCTLSRADVHRHVIDWPKGRVVEVRLCQSCGQSMARTASAVVETSAALVPTARVTMRTSSSLSPTGIDCAAFTRRFKKT